MKHRYIGKPGRGAEVGRVYSLEVSQDKTSAVYVAPILDLYQDSKLFEYPDADDFDKNWEEVSR